MHSRATDRRSAYKCQGKWPDQTLNQAFGLPEVLVAVSTSRLSCKRVGKTRTLMPVWDSSGESQIDVQGDSGARRGKQPRAGQRVAVLVPCFNEEVTIAKVVADFLAALPEATIYVYDNNSADR